MKHTNTNIKTAINKAASILKAGGIVSFPTETVYGLGADAENEKACRRIFAIKGRPLNHPLIVHIASINDLPYYAREVPAIALQLANAFWPGPLTLIFKKQSHVPDIVTGGQDSIALRIPNHPIASELLRAFGGGIAAPSANKFTYISATSAEAVANELGNDVDFIIDGGVSTLGLESTIIDVTSDIPRILRPGMISTTMLQELDPPILLSRKISKTRETIRAPGMHHLHYAPRTKTTLIETAAIPDLLQIPPSPLAGEGWDGGKLTPLAGKSSDLPIALMTHTYTRPAMQKFANKNIHVVTMPDNPMAYAHLLYRELRRLDHLNYQRIIIERVKEDAAWDAILDRLLKATSENYRQ